MKICYIDDSASGNGGTKLTLDSIMERSNHDIKYICSKNLSLKHLFFNFDLYILGNNFDLGSNSLLCLEELIKTKPFVKINFDYGYCKFRGPSPHKILSDGQDCDCKENKFKYYDLYEMQNTYALHIFYMSEAQRVIHSLQFTNFDSKKTSVLSSCFNSETLENLERLCISQKNEKYAIVDGNGGWHTQAKGVQESIGYAEQHNIEYDLIFSNDYVQFLEILSKYKGLIFLPIIEDTCPRLTIEARLLGLDLIINDNCQHTTEDWWGYEIPDIIKYINSRPSHFWKTIQCLKY